MPNMAHPAAAMHPRSVRVGLLGFGTVGAGVLELLHRNRETIERKVGRPVEVARIAVRSPDKPRAVQVPAELLTTRARDVVVDPDVHVVVEVMGGVHPARELITEALRRGKAVVTANKDVIAEYGQELFTAADSGGADLFFEASVGGGIPIIRALKESLAGNRVHRIAGVLNGTTNFILTRMTEAGAPFEEALREAQRLGYAEADPSADVEGWDAARKLAILSSIAYSARFLPRQVCREGITGVDPRDLDHGRRMGWTLKLLALSELDGDGRVGLRVQPTFIPAPHPLAAVRDAFNAIYVQGDGVGEAMFYGRGAGSLPTASSVLGDLIEAARLVDRGGKGLSCTCFYQYPVRPLDELRARFYLRLIVADRPGVLAHVAGVLGRNGVNILSVLQTPLQGESAELVLVTHEVAEGRMRRALSGLRRLEAVDRIAGMVRLAPEDL
jgi:homoserine dehydrogenase